MRNDRRSSLFGATGCALVLLIPSAAASYEVRAGLSNHLCGGSINPSNHSTSEPFIDYACSVLVTDFSWDFYASADAPDGRLVASIEHVRDGPGAGGPTSERYSYAEITETIRLSKALSGFGNGNPGIGLSGDDLLTVRLSVNRTGSTVAERPNQFASTSRIRWRVSLSKLESEGPTGATWTLARTYGDTLIETKNTANPDIRFGANWMELDIPESLIPFSGLASYRLFLRAEVEAVVSQGSTWIDSASAAGSLDLHFGVESGFNWTTSNGLLLSEGIYLPPELVPEPDALLGGLAAALTLAGLARRRRAHRRPP